MLTVSLSYVAGLLAMANPCVLPMLPIILASALEGSKRGPFALAAGLCVSFTLFGSVITGLAFSAGLSEDAIRTGAAVILVIFGLVMLSPLMQRQMSTALATGTGGLSTATNGAIDDLQGSDGNTGLWAQFLTGCLLGVLWVPCTGPTLGAAITLASQSPGALDAVAVMAAFGLGSATIVVLLALGTRSAIATRKNMLMAVSNYARPMIGILFIALGGLILSGMDKQIEIALLDMMPLWLMEWTVQF